MTSFDVDLFVIGGGSGGVRAARIAAGYGAKVMLAEEYRVGGTCVIRGCVPKKLLVYASRFADDFHDAAGFGWSLGETALRLGDPDPQQGQGDRPARGHLPGQSREGRRRDRRQPRRDRGRAYGPRAQDRRPHPRPHHPGGGRRPSDPGAGHPRRRARHHLERGLPSRRACRSASWSSAAAISRSSSPASSPGSAARSRSCTAATSSCAASTRMCAMPWARPMPSAASISPSAGPLTSLEKTADGIAATLSDGSVLTVDQVLVATGRRPNTEGLGLEKAGIAVDEVGAIPVDGYSQTLIPSIYAVGDVTNRANLTPIAIREGHAFADTVFGDKPTIVDHDLIPTAVFSTPEIGVIGCGEAAARAIYGEIDVYKTAFRPMKATLSGGKDRVFMKLIVDKATDKVRGRPRHGPRRGRDDPARRHRRHHGRHQGRFRPHRRGPPDGRGRAGDHAHARGGQEAGGGGVSHDAPGSLCLLRYPGHRRGDGVWCPLDVQARKPSASCALSSPPDSSFPFQHLAQFLRKMLKLGLEPPEGIVSRSRPFDTRLFDYVVYRCRFMPLVAVHDEH